MHSKPVVLVAFLVAVAAVPFGALGAAGATTTTDVSQASESLATQEDCAFPVTVTDGTGAEVTVEERPERVVVAGGSVPQVVWELGQQDRVVGMPVTFYTAYLEGSEERTNVVNQDGSLKQEEVVSLDPDVVLLPNIYSNETVQSLRNAGLTVYRAEFPSGFEGIRDRIRTYGRLLGSCERAGEVLTEFDEGVEAVRADAEGRDSPRVLYYSANFTVGSGTFVHEIMTTAGGTNVAAEAGVSGFRQVNLEMVAERDPEVVVVPAGSDLPTGEPWNSTTAYREGNIVRVDDNYVSQPGPRVVRALETMNEAFGAAVETSTPTGTGTAAATTTATATPSATATATMAEDDATAQQTPAADSGQDGAGFGLGAALVALAAGALLVTRRT